MTFSPEEALKFAKKCRKIGVTSVKIGEFEFHFSEKVENSIYPDKVAMPSHAPAIKQEMDQDVDPNLAQELRDFEMVQNLIDDPALFEEQMIKKARGESDARSI